MLVELFGLWIASGFGCWIRTPFFERIHYDLVQGLPGGLLPRGPARPAARDRDRRGRPRTRIPASRSWSAAGTPGPGDSFTLIYALMHWYGREPRVVLKDTLAWDPAIDVLLNRLPAGSSPRPQAGADLESADRRAGHGPRRERRVRDLPRGRQLHPAAARARHRPAPQARPGRGWPRRAEEMTNVLAPRPGGFLAALDAAPEADVVLVAHTGLDHLLTVGDVWRELPMDKQIIMRWWRVPREEIPADREARIDWLFSWWERIDAWVEEHRPEDARRARGRSTRTSRSSAGPRRRRRRPRPGASGVVGLVRLGRRRRPRPSSGRGRRRRRLAPGRRSGGRASGRRTTASWSLVLPVRSFLATQRADGRETRPSSRTASSAPLPRLALGPRRGRARPSRRRTGDLARDDGTAGASVRRTCAFGVGPGRNCLVGRPRRGRWSLARASRRSALPCRRASTAPEDLRPWPWLRPTRSSAWGRVSWYRIATGPGQLLTGCARGCPAEADAWEDRTCDAHDVQAKGRHVRPEGHPEDQPGRHRHQPVPRPRARDRRELRRPGRGDQGVRRRRGPYRRALLRRSRLPPGHRRTS